MSSAKKAVRDQFREAVLKRDGHRCAMCGRNDCKLDAHHITNRDFMPNGGYVVENGITLCDVEQGCHYKAEHWWGVGEGEHYPGFTPGELYSRVGSSYEAAVRASEKLK